MLSVSQHLEKAVNQKDSSQAMRAETEVCKRAAMQELLECSTDGCSLGTWGVQNEHLSTRPHHLRLQGIQPTCSETEAKNLLRQSRVCKATHEAELSLPWLSSTGFWKQPLCTTIYLLLMIRAFHEIRFVWCWPRAVVAASHFHNSIKLCFLLQVNQQSQLELEGAGGAHKAAKLLRKSEHFCLTLLTHIGFRGHPSPFTSRATCSLAAHPAAIFRLKSSQGEVSQYSPVQSTATKLPGLWCIRPQHCVTPRQKRDRVHYL